MSSTRLPSRPSIRLFCKFAPFAALFNLPSIHKSGHSLLFVHRKIHSFLRPFIFSCIRKFSSFPCPSVSPYIRPFLARLMFARTEGCPLPCPSVRPSALRRLGSASVLFIGRPARLSSGRGRRNSHLRLRLSGGFYHPGEGRAGGGVKRKNKRRTGGRAGK